MKLRKLELTNVCQHRHVVFEFGTGLIGIYGPNGSGKSNSMNVACYGILTNDWSRHELGKPGMICQQMEEGEKSAGELWFEQDGHDYYLLRGLKSPEKHLLKRPGQEDLKKAGEIQQELEGALGIKRRLIDDHIFVPQNELFAFLSETPADRAKSFAHLCNTTHSELCWDLVGKQIIADQPLADNVVDNSDEIRRQIGEYRGRLNPLKKELAEYRKQLVSQKKEKQLQQLVDKRAKHQAITGELPGLERAEKDKKAIAVRAERAWKDEKSKLDPLSAQLHEAEAELADARDKYEAGKEPAQEARNRLSEVKQIAAKLKEKEAAAAQLEAAQAALDAIVQVPEADTDAEEIHRQQEKLLERAIDKAEHLLEGCGDGAVECPTCGTPTKDLADQIAEAEIELPKLRENLEAARRSLTAIADQRKRRSKYESDLAAKKATVTAKQQEVAKYAKVRPVKKGTTAKCKEVIADQEAREAAKDEAQETVDELKQQVADLREEISDKETKKVQKQADHQAAAKTLEDKRGQLAENEIKEEDFVAANAELAQHKQAQVKVAGHKARVEELEGFIAEKRDELEQVKRRLARSTRARRWVQILTEVRDEVLHRDKLPRIVHKNYLLDMVDQVNGTLADFNAPFHVTVTEDVGFTAHFSNGTVMPAPGLSGGQKVVLALAFRLTVNSIFAPQLGTMVLDEPTDGLDKENRQMAAEFFRELGVVARSRGLQIVVITHDDEMERIFDQKIVLQRPV